MKKIRLSILCVFISGFFILGGSNALAAEEKPARPGTQGDVARLIGEELGYKADYILNLKGIGITPLGNWDPERALTKDDFDAILVRMTRRSPVVENQEPAKILDSMGFPPRETSLEGMKKVIASEAFRKVAINPKLLICQPILPLPPGFKIVSVATTEGMARIDVAAAAAAVEVTIPEPPEIDIPDEPQDPHKD